MGAIFSTDALRPAERFDYWHDVVYRTYAPCIGKVSSIEDFNASVTVSDFGGAQITHVDSSPITYDRRSFDVRTGPREDLYAVAMVSGKAALAQAGTDCTALAGDVYIYNSAQPYRQYYDGPYECISLRIPLPMVQSRLLELDQLSGRVLKGGSTYGRVLNSLIRQAVEISKDTEICQMSDFSTPLVDMIAASIGRSSSEQSDGTRNGDHLMRIKKYMRDNLADGELTLTRIAYDQNVSVRTLARLFADVGMTPMGWLQAQRLASAYSAIVEKKVGSVTEAAFTFGYNDLSHFGRSFKKAYGHTPNKLFEQHSK